ncbi:MAG: type IX secretion system membrane protein PorP/SprF [Bacteroidia bacterium]|nr:type IX secretion system membrane protein PorP/SprF [Bacteroidia bacterium]
MRFLTAISLVLLVLWGGISQAQQDPQYSQYMFNGLVLNPAYAGSRDMMSATAIVRQQWAGLEGAPATQSLSFHAPTVNLRNGYGISLWNDRIGATSTTNFEADYAFRIPMGKGANLALGLSGSLRNYRIDNSSLNLENTSDPSFVLNGFNKWMGNVGTGAWFQNKFMYLGASVPHILENSISGLSVPNISDRGRLHRHYLLTAGLILKLHSKVRFKPSALVKMVNGAPTSIDLNGSFLFWDKLWLGISWRQKAATVFILEWQISHQFRVGYAYDYLLSPVAPYSSGSHELMLGLDLDFKRAKMASPRYF